MSKNHMNRDYCEVYVTFLQGISDAHLAIRKCSLMISYPIPDLKICDTST